MANIDEILSNQKFKAGIEAVQQTPINTISELGRRAAIDAIKVKQPTQTNYPVPAYNGGDAAITGQKQPYLGTTLGIPIVTDLTIVGGSYVDNNGRTQTFPTIKLATVLMTVSLPMNIVKTIIQGRNGSVQEYIGQNDYDITINGIITGTNGSYPAAAVRQLHLTALAPVAKAIESTYLQNLRINTIVVEKIDYVQDPGGYSQQKFTLSCISSNPVNLVITLGKNGNTFTGTQQQNI